MAGPLKIVHIITRMILGGAQENTLYTVQGLHDNPGCHVMLVTGPALGPEGELVDEARRSGVAMEIVPEMRREIHPWRDMKTLRALTKLLRGMRPEIVHTHSSKAGILGRMAARRASVPIIIHTIHGQAFHPHQSWVFNALFAGLERHVGRYTDRLITVADAMKDQAIAARIAPPEKFVTIYSGMEVTPFLESPKCRDGMRARLGLAPDHQVVGKVARLAHLKGHEYVLELARRLCPAYPRLRFLLVGDGELRKELEDQAERMGVRDRLIFAGLVPAREIPAYLSAIDILVHASLREGLARVLPQALISGKPAVSFDVDGAREVVLDGETGFLVPEKSVDGLVRSVQALLDDPGRGRRMGECGRARFARQFDKDVMVAEIERVYREELQKKGMGGECLDVAGRSPAAPASSIRPDGCGTGHGS